MLNSSNEINSIIESGTGAVESVGNATRNLVDISLSGRYVKRPDESDEAYQTRLNFLSQRQAMQLRKQGIKAEERLSKQAMKAEVKLSRQGIKAEERLSKQAMKAEAQEKQRERKHLKQMQRQEAKRLKQKERIERKQNKC